LLLSIALIIGIIGLNFSRAGQLVCDDQKR